VSYADYRDQIQNCDILLYKGTSLVSRLIRWKTKSEYSHAGLVVGWDERLMTVEATGKGVYPIRLSKKIEKYHGSVELWRFNLPTFDADLYDMATFAKDEIGNEYPKWWDLLKFLGAPNRNDKFKLNQFIEMCAQLVARTYNYKGYDLVEGLSDEYTTPQALIDGGKIDLVEVFK